MAYAIKRLGNKASRWINFSLWTAAIMLLLTAGIGALGTIRLFSSEAEVYRSHEMISGLEQLLSLARALETGERGYIITGNPDYLEPYLSAQPKIEQQFNFLAPLVQGDVVQQQRLTKLRSLLDRKQAEMAHTIWLRRLEGFAAAQAFVLNDTGKAFMDQAHGIVRDMEAAARRQLDVLRENARTTRDLAIAIGLASGVLTLAVCLSFGYMMRRLLQVEASAADSLFEQRELLHVTLSSIGDAVIAIDVAGRITFFNRVAQDMTGWQSDAALGQPIESVLVFREASTQDVANPALVALAERRITRLVDHTRLAGRTGEEVHVDGSGAPTFDASGRLVGAVLVVRDVSERDRAEERFRLAVEAAPNAMIMANRDGRIVLVNSQAEQLFGYMRSEMIGRPVEMLVPERFRASHPGYRAAFYSAPNSRPMGAGRDLYGLRRDGTEFPVEIGLNPIETSEGVYVLSAIADITERKRAEWELRRSNEDLEQFAYVASHDLQEPLRAVAGPLQLLQRRYHGQLDARADEFIGHAVEGATRMQRLIEDLLSYSRIGRLEDPQQLTDCEQVLEQALKDLSATIHEAGAQIIHGALPAVRAIPAQLALVFQNLVGNAIKFRSKDRPVQIHVGAQAHGGEWLLRVEDNGIGIDPQYFERIFLIFQRLHTRRDYPGTGIGLALCKRIVERHGGRIWVESKPGKGTTFLFTLPRGVRHEREKDVA